MKEEKKIEKIIKKLMEDLPERYQFVLIRRYGLEGGSPFTLEAIGKDLGGVSRERVRQIKIKAQEKIKKNLKLIKPISEWAKNFLNFWGGIRKEEEFLKEAALVFLKKEPTPLFSNQFKFILELDEEIERKKETPFHFSYFYLPEKEKLFLKVIEFFKEKLKEVNRPLSLKEYETLVKKAKNKFSLTEGIISSFLSTSKEFDFNFLGEFGLKSWNEISPRKISEKIYLVFKKLNRPLHFQEASSYLQKEYPFEAFKPTTVHNELIKNPQFVLVGRGIYALKEWGYQGGRLSEVLERIFKRERRALTFDEIREKVKKELIVKDSTILLNLSSSPFFEKTKDGRWRYRKPKKIFEA